MPELPEVEVTRLGISPHIEGQEISKILIHQKSLRWPVPDEVLLAQGQKINNVSRRAKYLFLHTNNGSIILHLGMSGKMRVIDSSLERQKHDHLEFILSSGKKLVFNDPRRFGCCLWQGIDDETNSLLTKLGPEPLSDSFNTDVLYTLSRGKQSPVKNFIMDNHVVVGVGNIYANEALFMAGIDPRRPAGKVSEKRYALLTDCIKQVLSKAIEQGGTTLKDFAQADGNPGYFAQHLHVYGRTGKPCDKCDAPIRSKVIGQRNTFFCIKCQR